MHLMGPFARMGQHNLATTAIYPGNFLFCFWRKNTIIWFFSFPDEYNESVNPAAKYTPYFCADVHAGDVLYNPTW